MLLNRFPSRGQRKNKGTSEQMLLRRFPNLFRHNLVVIS